jgi:aminomethyltransferase
VGFITSALYSPRLARNIGYANVPAALGALGQRLRVQVPAAGEREAVVVVKPFVDPSKEIPKA